MQFFIPNYATMLPFDLQVSLNKDKLEHVVKFVEFVFHIRENIDACNPGVCEKTITRYANCIHVTFASFYYH